MKIETLLKIQSLVEKRSTPVDMYEEEILYYSETKSEYVNILQMDLVHFIRAYRKTRDALVDLSRQAAEKDGPPEYITINETTYRKEV